MKDEMPSNHITTYVGYKTIATFSGFKAFARLIGHIIIELAKTIRHPSHFHLDDFMESLYQFGPLCLPTIILLMALLSAVTTLVGEAQLLAVNATSHLATLSIIIFFRVIGPGLTVLIILFRAPHEMIPKESFWPHIIAAIFMGPMLFCWAVGVSLLVNITVAPWLGINFSKYILELKASLSFSILWLGIAKTALYSFIITLCILHYHRKAISEQPSLKHIIFSGMIWLLICDTIVEIVIK